MFMIRHDDDDDDEGGSGGARGIPPPSVTTTSAADGGGGGCVAWDGERRLIACPGGVWCAVCAETWATATPPQPASDRRWCADASARTWRWSLASTRHRGVRPSHALQRPSPRARGRRRAARRAPNARRWAVAVVVVAVVADAHGAGDHGRRDDEAAHRSGLGGGLHFITT